MAIEQIDLEAVRAALKSAVQYRRSDRVREVLEQVSPTDAVAILHELSPSVLASVVALGAMTWLPISSRA